MPYFTQRQRERILKNTKRHGPSSVKRKHCQIENDDLGVCHNNCLETKT